MYLCLLLLISQSIIRIVTNFKVAVFCVEESWLAAALAKGIKSARKQASKDRIEETELAHTVVENIWAHLR